jgi:hypothetical protein
MDQTIDAKKIFKSYRMAIYIAYGASLFAFILAILGVSDGLWTDFVVYLFFAAIINIFKNKISGIIVIILSAIQFIMVLISVGAGNSRSIEILISAVVFANLFTFYKMIAKVGSIKKLKEQYGNTK